MSTTASTSLTAWRGTRAAIFRRQRSSPSSHCACPSRRPQRRRSFPASDLEVFGDGAFDLTRLGRVFVFRRGADVDVVDAPLVLLLAEHDAVADPVLVAAQL